MLHCLLYYLISTPQYCNINQKHCIAGKTSSADMRLNVRTIRLIDFSLSLHKLYRIIQCLDKY
jgi:hypothetical protein